MARLAPLEPTPPRGLPLYRPRWRSGLSIRPWLRCRPWHRRISRKHGSVGLDRNLPTSDCQRPYIRHTLETLHRVSSHRAVGRAQTAGERAAQPRLKLPRHAMIGGAHQCRAGGRAVVRGSASMISGQQCRTYSAACVALGMSTNISVQRATVLLAMSRSWTTLATQKDRYDSILEEEGERRGSVPLDRARSSSLT